MKPIVSRARTKKTRSREKRAEKAAGGHKPLHEHSMVAFLAALALWATVLMLLGFEQLMVKWTEGVVFQFISRGAFLAVGLFAAAMFLYIASPATLLRNKTVLLLVMVSLVSLGAMKGVLYFSRISNLVNPDLAVFLLPVAMAPLLATILAGGTAGLAVGFLTSFALAVFNRGSFTMLCNGMLATVVCAAAAGDVRTRSKVLKIGIAAGLSKLACLFALTAMNWAISDVMPILQQALACLGGEFLSAVVVLLIVPLFEWLFKITTNITLLELSDLGHPLLQRLAIEAPGTYHHSLVVANLAQAAADEIGANSLLTRVCSYFHDIGKLVKPGFFAENIQLQPNPHDNLPPSMSTLVITSHVKEGLSLALLHNLPECVKNVIQEHHGTSLLSYFHHKATKQMQLDDTGITGGQTDQPRVDEGTFRYVGPAPTTRESAIIHLADSVEAASRSMEKTTPGHIENLVRDIVDARIRDGQLDRSQLTFNEVAKIKNSFVFTLTSMLHGRVAYPKDENRTKQQATRLQAVPPAADETGRGVREANERNGRRPRLAGDVDSSDR